jgi:hypothetical protein
MHDNRYKAIECRISRGGFSDERVFTLADGYSGAASRQYFWTREGRPLEEGEPPIGQVTDGFVAVRVIQVEGDNKLLVSLPDGEVIELNADALAERPSGVGEHVPR